MRRKPPDLKILGEVLRSFREETGLSQEAVAERAGLHRTYVGGVERGERNPTFLSLTRMLRALGVSWTEFARKLESRSG